MYNDIYSVIWRYEVAVHVITCLLLLLLFLFYFRIRLKPNSNRQLRVIYYTIITALSVQIPVSYARIESSLSPGFKIKCPMDAYLDLFYSPLCTNYIIWFFLVHLMLNSIVSIREDVIKISINFYKLYVPICIFIGFISSMILNIILPSIENTGSLHIIIACFIGFFGSLIEIIYHVNRYKVIRMITYSWLWMIGSFSYFIFSIALF